MVVWRRSSVIDSVLKIAHKAFAQLLTIRSYTPQKWGTASSLNCHLFSLLKYKFRYPFSVPFCNIVSKLSLRNFALLAPIIVFGVPLSGKNPNIALRLRSVFNLSTSSVCHGSPSDNWTDNTIVFRFFVLRWVGANLLCGHLSFDIDTTPHLIAFLIQLDRLPKPNELLTGNLWFFSRIPNHSLIFKYNYFCWKFDGKMTYQVCWQKSEICLRKDSDGYRF